MDLELLTRAEVEHIRAGVRRLLRSMGELDFCQRCSEPIVLVEDCCGSLVTYGTAGARHVCSIPSIPFYVM